MGPWRWGWALRKELRNGLGCEGRAQPLSRHQGAHQQVGPALATPQSNQQHLLDQGQLPLACGLLLAGLTLCGGLSKGAVHQDPLPHREVLHQEHQPPVRELVDLVGDSSQ